MPEHPDPYRPLPDGTEIRTEAVAYTVSAWPQDLADDPERGHWTCRVAHRGRGLWAVVRGDADGGPVLDSSGRWDFEPIPSEREDDWLQAHRFPLERALELAREACTGIVVNGMNVAAWKRARGAGRHD